MQFLAVFSTLAIYLLVTPHFVNPARIPVTQTAATSPTTLKAEILEGKKALDKAEAPDPTDGQGDPPGAIDDLGNDASHRVTSDKAESVPNIPNESEAGKPSLAANDDINNGPDKPLSDTNNDKNNVADAENTEKSAESVPNESEAGGTSLETNDDENNGPDKPLSGTNNDKNNVADAENTEKSAVSVPNVPNESEAGEPSLETNDDKNNGPDKPPSDTNDDKNKVVGTETMGKSDVTDKMQESPLKSDVGEGDNLNPKNITKQITTEKTGELNEAVNTGEKIENDAAKSTNEPEKSTTKSTDSTKTDIPDQGDGADSNPQPSDTEKNEEQKSDDEVNTDTGVVGNLDEKVPSDDKENGSEPTEKTSMETTEKSEDGSKTVGSDIITEAPETSIPPPTDAEIIDMDEPKDVETENGQDTEPTEEETGEEAGETETISEEGGESPDEGGLVISPEEEGLGNTEENPADEEGDTGDAHDGIDDSDPETNFDSTGGDNDIPITDNNGDEAQDFEWDSDTLKDDVETEGFESKLPHEIVFDYPDFGNTAAGNSDIYDDGFMDGEEHSKGHFFAFILTAMFFTAAAYLLYHNKRKVVALVLPGAQRRTGMRHRAGYKANYDRLENKPDWR